jgi:hypothetical protein
MQHRTRAIDSGFTKTGMCNLREKRITFSRVRARLLLSCINVVLLIFAIYLAIFTSYSYFTIILTAIIIFNFLVYAIKRL